MHLPPQLDILLFSLSALKCVDVGVAGAELITVGECQKLLVGPLACHQGVGITVPGIHTSSSHQDNTIINSTQTLSSLFCFISKKLTF